MPRGKRKRKRSDSSKEELCCLCRSVKTDRTNKYRPLPLQEAAVEAVKTHHKKWKNKVDCPEAILPGLTYLDEVFELSETPSLQWHSSCRATFMSTWRLDQYEDIQLLPDPNFEDEDDEQAAR